MDTFLSISRCWIQVRAPGAPARRGDTERSGINGIVSMVDLKSMIDSYSVCVYIYIYVFIYTCHER